MRGPVGIAAVLAALAVGHHAWAQQYPIEYPYAADQGDRSRGRAVVVGATPQGQAAACMQCHRIDGQGDAVAGFPRLSGLSADFLYKSLLDYASGARNNSVMSPIARAMSRAEMKDTAVYYAAQETRATVFPDAPNPALLQRGGTLSAIGDSKIKVQACQNCHGPQGIGLGGTYPGLAGQHATYLEQQLLAWQKGHRIDPEGVMQIIAGRLDEQDIRAVAAYFSSLPAPTRDLTAEFGK